MDRGYRAISYGRQIREALDLTCDAAREVHEQIEGRREVGGEDGRGERQLHQQDRTGG